MPVMTKTPNGEDIVILSRQEYDDLIEDKEDIADRAVLLAAMARRDAGGEEYLTSEEVNEFLAAKTPLAFWRKKRGVTQATLAEQVGVSESVLAGLEDGEPVGDIGTLERVAIALNLALEDLTLDDPVTSGEGL
jgi:DNA-binding XRE family transcriptional regulator